MFGFDENKLLVHINDYSEQLLSELCQYGLLNKKYNPEPKLKLMQSQLINPQSRHDIIIKIVVGEQLFETSAAVLSKSTYFDTKIKLSKTKQFYLSDVDPKIFRYVLNFLRIGELYVNNADIIELLNKYGVEYESLTDNKITANIVSHYIPNSLETINNQMNGYINIFDPQQNGISQSNAMCQFIDNKYYYPSSMLASPNIENFNVITTESELLFGSDIIFNLTNPQLDLGECIEDLLLSIDIPVMKSSDTEYIDNIEYQLIESIDIITVNGTSKKLMMHTDNNLLYLHPRNHTNNHQDYHNMTKINGKKMKLLYDNTLIDIQQITLPLFLFSNGQNTFTS